MQGLILHSGAEQITRDQLARVETPEPVDRWFPIPHLRLVDQVESALAESSLSIVESKFGIGGDAGARFFGLMQLRNGGVIETDDFGLMLGLRNSHDQKFSASLVVGSRVFVCDNLAFSGEIRIARKHTRNISRDLPLLVDRAIGQLGAARIAQSQRIEAYKGKKINDAQFHDIAIRLIDDGVYSPSKVRKVVDEWRAPSHSEFEPRTVWSGFNAVTEVLKGSNLFETPRKTQALHGVMDLVAGVDYKITDPALAATN